MLLRRSVFVWIALASMAILLVPLVVRRTGRGRRVVIGMIFLAAFLYIWAELAVGIFTNYGS